MLECQLSLNPAASGREMPPATLRETHNVIPRALGAPVRKPLAGPHARRAGMRGAEITGMTGTIRTGTVTQTIASMRLVTDDIIAVAATDTAMFRQGPTIRAVYAAIRIAVDLAATTWADHA